MIKTKASILEKIKITWEYGAPHNPDFPYADGWKVRLKYQGRQMTINFYKGPGHNGEPPTLEEVIECLCADAYLAELDYEDFCAEVGYNAPSLGAKVKYDAVVSQTFKLKNLLGDDFNILMWGY